MSLLWGFVVAIGAGCVLMWSLLTASFAKGDGPRSGRRAAAAAAILVAPFFVAVELMFLALAKGSAWPSLPWVIAGVGAISAAVLVPLMATQTPRLPPDTRRRAVTNIATIIVLCTLIAESFAFKDAAWSKLVFPLLLVAGLILRAVDRRKSPAG